MPYAMDAKAGKSGADLRSRFVCVDMIFACIHSDLDPRMAKVVMVPLNSSFFFDWFFRMYSATRWADAGGRVNIPSGCVG